MASLLMAASSACSAADSLLVSADAGLLILQRTKGQATLSTGSVSIPQDIGKKVDLANRLGLTALACLDQADPARRWHWLGGLHVLTDSYDVKLSNASEQEHQQGRNFACEVLLGPTLNLAAGWDVALLAMGGAAHGTYDDTLVRNDLSSVTVDGQVRGWLYGARLLSTLAVSEHLRLGGWAAYEITRLNQYGPATIDLGPNWPFPSSRVSTGRVDADVTTHGWALGISLGYGW